MTCRNNHKPKSYHQSNPVISSQNYKMYLIAFVEEETKIRKNDPELLPAT